MPRNWARARHSGDRSFDLTDFSLRDMAECGAALRALGAASTGFQDTAQRLAQYLFAHLRDRGTGGEQCVLVRCFVTRPFSMLDATERDLAVSALGRAPRSPGMKCLTLLGTAGLQPGWNDRLNSFRYRAIPLISEQFVGQFPMFSQLLKQLGVKIQPLLRPDSDLLMDWEERTHNVFYVPEAVDSPFVPKQQEFVVRYRVKSTLGFGGLLPSGNLFAVILFSKARIPSETADHFRTLALSAKLALLTYDQDAETEGAGKRTGGKESRREETVQARLRYETSTMRQLLEVHERTVIADVIHRDLAEARLEQLRRDYELLLNSAKDGIYGVDREGNTTFVNPSGAKMLGWETEEIVGRPMHALMHYCKADRTPYLSDECPINRTLREGTTHDVEDEVFWRKDGTSFEVEYSSTPILENGRIIGAVVTFRDVTERKKVARLLRESNERYRRLVEVSPDAIFINRGGQIVFVNEEGLKLFGAERADQVLGKSPFEFIHRDNHDDVRQRIRRLLEEGARSVPLVEERYVRLDGTEVAVEVTATRVVDGGEPAVQVVARNITERREAEAALKQAEAQYQSIFENAVEGIFQTTPDGRFQAANPALARMCGYDSPQDLMRSITDIEAQLYVDPKDRLAFKRLIEQDGMVRGFEYQMYRKDRTRLWASEHARAVRDPEGMVVCYEGTIEDITDRREVQAKLQETLVRLRTLSKRLESVREEERARIARELHDELGVGLTCLKIDLARVQSLLEPGTNTKERGKIQDKMQSMIEQVDATITAVQRIVAELRPGVLDDLGLVAAIEWQCRDFERRTGIACTCETGAEDIFIAPDRATAVFRICQEALTNVARHARATAVSVRLQHEGDRLCLEVQDNGCGIPAEKLSDASAFGLMGMHERVRDLQGDLQIRGEDGRGTTITMTIRV